MGTQLKMIKTNNPFYLPSSSISSKKCKVCLKPVVDFIECQLSAWGLIDGLSDESSIGKGWPNISTTVKFSVLAHLWLDIQTGIFVHFVTLVTIDSGSNIRSSYQNYISSFDCISNFNKITILSIKIVYKFASSFILSCYDIHGENKDKKWLRLFFLLTIRINIKKCLSYLQQNFCHRFSS